MMIVDPFRFRGSNPATISYEGSAFAAGGATQTIPSVPIGAADNLRTVIQTISWTDVVGSALTSATIGGIAADICVQFSAVHLGATFGYCAIISADVPTGTTATTVLNFSTAPAPALVESFRAFSLMSKTATDTETATALGATSLAVSPDVLAGGIIVAATTARTAGTFTITGATEDYDTTFGGSLVFAGGHYSTPTAETAHAITFTGVGFAFNGPIVAAAFR
jgi:hypothetical protein